MRSTVTILSSIGAESEERCKNFSDALLSWQATGANIVLFNKTAAHGLPYTIINPENDPPTIKEMLDWYSPDRGRADEGIVILVNGDIMLTNDVMGVKKIGDSLGRIWAATSFRHEFESDGKDNGVVDEGLDFFVTTKTIAARIAKDIPPFLTLGRGLWDNWMNGWLRKNLPPQRYFDLTDWKCVLHPKHDRVPGRLSNYSEDQTKQVLSHPNIVCGGIPKIKYLKQ